MENKTVATEYFHINNGGVEFSVEDTDFGPTIVVKSTHMGANTNTQRISVDRDGLEAVAEVFEKAAKASFLGKPYCELAKPASRREKSVEKEPEYVIIKDVEEFVLGSFFIF